MKRTYVRVTLTMQSGWRVGAWESQAADVVATLTDSDGHPIVPGSGIAGALRQAAGDKREELFGKDPGSADLVASPWWVLGTVVGGSTTQERQRTRIDRERGAAAERGLFRAEEVDPGDATSPCTVMIYLRREHDGATDVIRPLADLLRGWGPRIGGGRSIGMGQATITEVKHRTFNLDDKEPVRDLLMASGSPFRRVDALLDDKQANVERVTGTETKPYLEATLTVGFLAVTDTFADRIHGSTWKGLLRSRVEFIGRSLGYNDVCGADTVEQEGKQKQADWAGCGKCAVCRVFGSAARPGIWEFTDSPWSGKQVLERQRIAIDRFTGGVRDGALWPQLYVKDVGLRLVVNGVAPQPEDDWVRLALLHAVHDLDDGLISVGPEGAAGYGTARVKKSTVQLAGTNVKLQNLEPVPLPATEKALA